MGKECNHVFSVRGKKEDLLPPKRKSSSTELYQVLGQVYVAHW